MLFTDLPLCESLLDGLQAMNFKKTTPIQEQAIPVILDKKDVMACAQTGTGKTAAFLLPLINNLQTEPHDKRKVNAIIMAPTRELAQQIDQQMEGFSYFTPFSSVAVYGGNDGEAWDVQKRGLINGADVVIATPGRLLSHINLYNIDFSGVKYFILDEADRMLDMGFFDDIMKIEKLLPKDRQTIMFSATMPPKIRKLAKSILRDPEEINIAITRPPETIMQSVYLCYKPQKMKILRKLFEEKKPKKVLLFSESKAKVKEISRTLKRMGISAGEMHSDLDQSQRDNIMHEFRNERVDVLVATDIVARGIDIDDITVVINFEVPYDVEDYVHRIGRTARAGDTGRAITFVAPDEQYRLKQIEDFLGKEIQRIPLPKGMGEAPEYNPTREQRRKGKGRSGASRTNRQGRRKQHSGRKDNHRPSGANKDNRKKREQANKQKRTGEEKENKPNQGNNKQRNRRRPQRETTPGQNRSVTEKNKNSTSNKKRRYGKQHRNSASRQQGDDNKRKNVHRDGNAPRRKKTRSGGPQRKFEVSANQQKNSSKKPQHTAKVKVSNKTLEKGKEQKGKKLGILSWLFGKRK